jgi:lysyl-tRNA synthetase class 2
VKHSKTLRKSMTDAEIRLWSRLRGEQLGAKFRRQHEMSGYILDFVCIEKNLVIEIDGSQHQQQATYDSKRTQALNALGFDVLRYWNSEVLASTDQVIEDIVRALALASPPHPNPLPRRRRGKGSPTAVARSHEGQNTAVEAVSNSAVAKPPSFLSQASQSEKAGVERRNELRDRLALRAAINRLVREFFRSRDVLEVETPILSEAGNTEPNIESFTTHFTGHTSAGARERWLRTSPEFPLKRLLAAGIGDCYELGRVFRNNEAGIRHNPEFTMLEWYRVGWDHQRLAEETIELVQLALASVERRADVHHCTYRQLFQQELGIDALVDPIERLREPLQAIAIDPSGLAREDWLDLLITHLLQPRFPRDRITVITDWPASQCALARIRQDDPPVAERFELYLGPYELANGYHELKNAKEQRQRFLRDNARRRERGQREVPIDERLLDVLDDLPDCAGVALGIERLLMCLAGSDDIRDVLAMDFSSA